MIFKEYSVKVSLKNIKKWADDSESSQTFQKKKLIRGEPHNSWLDQLKLKNQIDLITW